MKFCSCRIEFLLHLGEKYVICLLLTADASPSLPLCHINNIHRLPSPSCCLLWPVEQPYHLNISYLINMSLERALVGPGSCTVNSAVGTCSYPNGPSADCADIPFVSLSVSVSVRTFSCQCSVVFYSFPFTVRCKQSATEAFKNNPQREPWCVFLMTS